MWFESTQADSLFRKVDRMEPLEASQMPPEEWLNNLHAGAFQLPEDTRFPLCKPDKAPLPLHGNDGTNRAMRRSKLFRRKSA